MLEKLKSRKFWVTFVTMAIVLLADELGFDRDQTLQVVGMAGTYVFGQGYVDAKAIGEKMPKAIAAKSE